MTCDDCPNATDGTCCHQLIRPHGSKTMNVLDIQAWERELNHAAKMQKQREGWDGKKPVIKTTATIPFNTYSIKKTANEK